MKTIGTDVSLQTCKAEGYTMIQYDARKRFNQDAYYRIFDYYPEYCEGVAGNIMHDTEYTFNELVERYDSQKKGLDSFAETHKYVNFDNPNYWDFLNLASDLLAYCGLE